ncbi:hypothetical protein PkP19E3_09935 [Pseudomonas koreensis]|nr:hypothetical protein PkP19E3_09935 [Pseudomonas koreensis]
MSGALNADLQSTAVPVGASLLANAVKQPTFLSSDTPLSRAGSLPQGDLFQAERCTSHCLKAVIATVSGRDCRRVSQ